MEGKLECDRKNWWGNECVMGKHGRETRICDGENRICGRETAGKLEYDSES